MMFEGGQDRVPTGKTRRGVVLGTAATRAGIAKAVHLTRRGFLSDELKEQTDHENEEEIARIVVAGLSTLRGTALKVAQLMALESQWFPEHVRRELSKACHRVPPLGKALVMKVLRKEFGATFREQFQSFEWEAFAAASLGQVHAAQLHDGSEVAVKIQYPGIAEAIASDIAWLKALLRPTRYHGLLASSFPVVEKTLEEEMDYTLEAENTMLFHVQLPQDCFAVPAVIKELSTRNVLTTERLKGPHLMEWLDTQPSEQQRFHFARYLAQVFALGLNKIGCLQADPNPGNFLFLPDGRLGLIDFGCVFRVCSDSNAAIRDLLKDAVSPKQLMEQHGEAFGFVFRKEVNVKQQQELVSMWVDWIRLPFAREGFDFARADDFFEQGEWIDREWMKALDGYRGRFLFFGRTLHGLLRILGTLGVPVNLHQILAESVAGPVFKE